MKIGCYFAGEENLGGAERRISRIFDSVNEKNFDITILVQSDKKREQVKRVYKSFLKKDTSVKIQVIGKGYLRLFMYTFQQKYDLVCYIDMCYSEVPFLLGAFFSRAKRLWLIVSTELAKIENQRINRQLLFELFNYLANNVDCLYPMAKNKLESKLKKVITITPIPFTDKNKFYPKEKIRSIVFVSRLIPLKNPELYVEIVNNIKDVLRQEKYSVILAGDGELYSKLEKRIRNYQLEDIIKLTGYVDSSKYLPRASVFFSIQEMDNYPSQSLIEAISCGCYIIATNIGDTHKIVNNKFGILCQKSVKVMSQAIVDYINFNKEKKENIIREATKFADDNFRKEESVKHFEKIFNKYS